MFSMKIFMYIQKDLLYLIGILTTEKIFVSVYKIVHHKNHAGALEIFLLCKKLLLTLKNLAIYH